jgi:putative membrane protein
MIDLAIKVAINAAALLVAANFVPEFVLKFGKDKPDEWVEVLVVALIFALVNSYIKPIVKTLALPIGFLTMGLVAFVINAAMLLGTAAIVDQAKSSLHIVFSVGGFPPHWGYEAVGCAVIASIVISVVSTVLALVLIPRKFVGF